MKRWTVSVELSIRSRCRVMACILSASLVLTMLASLSATPDNTTPDEITLGMSTALTGPASDLGLGMRDGVSAAIGEINRAGGIRNRPVRLIALDDGYEPANTAPNMRQLIEKDQVVTVIGNVGTPTAVAAVPIAMSSKTPFYGAFTGAGMLRKTPPDHCVVNYRASYAEETGAMVDALIQHAGLKPQQIAFFTQRDAFGDAGFSGGLAALKRHGLTDESAIAHGRYERNTEAVENAVADLLQADPPARAVIMVGTYAPCAKFIRLAKDAGMDALFLNVSFVGPVSLAKGLGDQGEGVIITEVVPHFDADLPVVHQYLAAIKAENSAAEPTFPGLEGYIAMRVLGLALAKIDGKPDREGVIQALEGLGEFEMGLGVKLHLSPDDHQACHTVWPTVIRGGKVVPLDWAELNPSRTVSGEHD